MSALVLALLLLSANRVVARERMIELLWGERPPATAATPTPMPIDTQNGRP